MDFSFSEDTEAIRELGGQIFEDRCSHADAPIADGYVHRREKCVACPWHGAEFDLRSGKAMTPPACEDITAFPTAVGGGEVLIEIGSG